MKKKLILLIIALLVGLLPEGFTDAKQASVKVINGKKITIEVGKKHTIKIKQKTKTVKFKTSKRKVATVSAKGGVKAKKKGTTKITIISKKGLKKAVVSVTVVAKSKSKATQKTTKTAKTKGNTVTPTKPELNKPTATPDPSIKYLCTEPPVADYDRLRAECGPYREISVPVWVGGPAFPEMTDLEFLGTNVLRKDIQQITIEDTINIPNEALKVFDVSEKQNKSVMAWFEDKDNDNKYEVTIAQEGGVVANENSNYLFSYLSSGNDNIPGGIINIEKLKTDKVVNMNSMFRETKFKDGSIDLGDNFDTSKVTSMYDMFFDTSFINDAIKEVRLGKKFSLDSVEKIAGIFYNCGDPYNVKVIAPNAKVRSKLRNLTAFTFGPYRIGTPYNKLEALTRFYCISEKEKYIESDFSKEKASEPNYIKANEENKAVLYADGSIDFSVKKDSKNELIINHLSQYDTGYYYDLKACKCFTARVKKKSETNMKLYELEHDDEQTYEREAKPKYIIDNNDGTYTYVYKVSEDFKICNESKFVFEGEDDIKILSTNTWDEYWTKDDRYLKYD